MRWHTPLVAFLVSVVVLLLSGATGRSAQQEKLTFWTTEIEPKRMTVQTDLANRFKKTTGIAVEIVPVKESELPTRVVAAAAANALPDVIFVPLDYVVTWTEEGILDPQPASAVIKHLGVKTFASGPLNLAKAGAGWAAVPADGWGQILLYRKDLFAGVAPQRVLGAPTTWEEILSAAQALHAPPKVWGIAVGTDPTQVYMQQIFEQFALSNGVRLVDPATGKLDLETPEFIETLKFYKKLASFTPPGNIYWRQTREDYLAGRQAMIIWSPFILDELAGLRDSVPVTATGLAKPLYQMTGIVTAIKGSSGSKPAQWGQVSYFGITVGARSNAGRWIQFLLEDGYLDWLSMAPEGKFPMRPKFIGGWQQLKIGVDRKAEIADLYSDEVTENIIAGVDHFDRWGFASGKGACMGQIYGTKELIRNLRRYLDEEISAEAAAKQMTEALRALDGCS
jgi:multiple sugar transport system substrate-binding protein